MDDQMEIDGESDGVKLNDGCHHRKQNDIPRRHRHSQIRHTFGGPSQHFHDSGLTFWKEPGVDVFIPGNSALASSEEMQRDYLDRASSCYANSNGRSYDSQHFQGFNRNPQVYLLRLLPKPSHERLEDNDEFGRLFEGVSVDDSFNAGKCRYDDEENEREKQQLQSQDEGEVEQPRKNLDREMETDPMPDQIQEEEPDPDSKLAKRQTSVEKQILLRDPHDGGGDAGANVPACPPALPNNLQKLYRSIECPPSATQITHGMIRANEEALARSEDFLIAETRATKLYQKDLATLRYRESGWLTDPVIDLYLNLIKESYPRVYVFESSFFALLTATEGAKTVEESASEINPFDFDLLLFPCCESFHWRLFVANIPQKRISSYNSLSWRSYTEEDNEYRSTLEEFLKAEASRRSLPIFDWIKVREHAPLQDNVKDCGVFLLQFARYVCRREPFNFTSKNMTYFRERIMYECLTKQLLPN